MDLTKLDLTFCELSRDQKIGLLTAWLDGKKIEYFSVNNNWKEVGQPAWQNPTKYRVASTKPQIDWSHVSLKWKWLAMDKNGEHWLYDDKPQQSSAYWHGSLNVSTTECLASLIHGTCDWKESLIGRNG